MASVSVSIESTLALTTGLQIDENQLFWMDQLDGSIDIHLFVYKQLIYVNTAFYNYIKLT